jgi:cytochrome b involved in lipid metabolism
LNKSIILCLGLLFGFVLLFGCAVTINPQDISPINATTGANSGDFNSLNIDNNSNSSVGQKQIILSLAEVSKHNKASDCWMIINGNVYDLTSYVGHPGGSTYVPYCGTDGTQGYDTKGNRGGGHSSYADSLLLSYLIGTIGQTITVQTQNSSQGQTTATRGVTNTSTLPNYKQEEYDD